MTPQEARERAQLVNELSWAAYWNSKTIDLSKWTREELGKRYMELCELLPKWDGQHHYAPDGHRIQYRIDDAFIEWQRKYEAECRAIEVELSKRSGFR